MMNKLHDYIAQMPALPASTKKILELSQSKQSTAADINKVIQLDPVLTGKLLQLVNSSYYGLNAKVTSLVRAIIMLGLNTVKNLALSTALFSGIGRQEAFRSLDADDFWEHSLAVAVTARLIAKKILGIAEEAEVFFIAGLLHDVGKIPLDSCCSRQYADILARKSGDLVILEKKNLGLTHCNVGKMILEEWKLDKPVIDAVEYHHDPLLYKGKHRILVGSIAAANNFVNHEKIGFAGDFGCKELDRQLWGILQYNFDTLREFSDYVEEELKQYRTFLDISKGEANET